MATMFWSRRALRLALARLIVPMTPRLSFSLAETFLARPVPIPTQSPVVVSRLVFRKDRRDIECCMDRYEVRGWLFGLAHRSRLRTCAFPCQPFLQRRIGPARDEVGAVGETFGPLGELCHQTCPPLPHQGTLGCHSGQVMLLAGVRAQVEQVLSSVEGPPDIFELAIG